MAYDWRVAFLTNLIPPYHKPLFTLLSAQYMNFRLFISTPMEANRPWLPEWAGLDVAVQKVLTLRRKWRHPRGFEETVAVHFPIDTIQQLTRFRPNVVVSVEMGFRSLLACLYTKMHPHCRLLIWTEVTDVTERGRGNSRRLLRRFLASRAHAFLAVGSGGARYLHNLRVPGERIFTLAYSTNLASFSAAPLERHGPEAHHLLFSGQLVERKGLLAFLSTLAQWANQHPERDIEFSLAGDGPLRDTLAQTPVPPNVKLMFIGTLQYHRLPDLYANSGIFVLPTLADTWAVVVNEAMASGVPVLGSVYSQAVAGMVEDGKSGWTFHPDNPEEMYSALDRALSTTDSQLNLMRARARSRALEVTPEKAAIIFHQALRFALENQ